MSRAGSRPPEVSVAQEPGAAIGFFRKTAWLALPAADTRLVVDALELAPERPAAWLELEDVSRFSGPPPVPVFVTPVVDGWVLAVLPPQLAEADALDLSGLSRRFGEVQKFASHSVVDYYEWQRWEAGEPVRRFCWVGDRDEVVLDDGNRAQAESWLTAEDHAAAGRPPDEEIVLAIAAEWSIDPSTLEGRSDLAAGPIIGLRQLPPRQR